MIPKRIHYCWFGEKELSEKAKKCISSWKRYCPDYEIREWNETNYDVHQNAYTRFCYKSKKYAFLSDYARLQIIYNEGGIYFDVDVEVVKKFDELLQYEAFYGFETADFVNTGLGFGAMVQHETVRKMLDEYIPFLDGKSGVTGCPGLNTEALKKMGLIPNGKRQTVSGAVILPADVLNPYDDPTGILRKTENTFSIHWYSKSWMSRSSVLKSKITKPIHRLQKMAGWNYE